MTSPYLTLISSTNSDEVAKAARAFASVSPDDTYDKLTFGGFGVLSAALALQNAEVARLRARLGLCEGINF